MMNPDASGETLAGVKAIEAISMAWTARALFIAYVGLYLMAFSTSLEHVNDIQLDGICDQLIPKPLASEHRQCGV